MDLASEGVSAPVEFTARGGDGYAVFLNEDRSALVVGPDGDVLPVEEGRLRHVAEALLQASVHGARRR